MLNLPHAAIFQFFLAISQLLVLADLTASQISIQVLDATLGAPIPSASLVMSRTGETYLGDSTGWVRVPLDEYSDGDALVSADGFHRTRIHLNFKMELSVQTSRKVLLKPIIQELEAFPVEGELTEEDRALLADRNRPAAGTTVSGEALRDIANESTSDALENVAGVSTSSEEGEVAGISIRGAGPRQTRVTLDGQSLGGGGGRGTTRGAQAMNQIPREFLSEVQVMKAPTPDMDADAVGGTINLQTIRVANTPTPRSTLTIRSSYKEFSPSLSNRLTFAHSQPVPLKNKSRKLGFLLTLNASKNENDGTLLRVLNRWPERQDPNSGEVHPVMARFRVTEREIDSEAWGLLFGADFQLNPKNTFQLKIIWNTSSNRSSFQNHSFDFIAGDIKDLTGETGNFSGMSLEKSFSENQPTNTNAVIVLTAQQELGDWKLDQGIGFSTAETMDKDSLAGRFTTPRNLDSNCVKKQGLIHIF